MGLAVTGIVKMCCPGERRYRRSAREFDMLAGRFRLGGDGDTFIFSGQVAYILGPSDSVPMFAQNGNNRGIQRWVIVRAEGVF